jgi:hypothetical protein
MNENDHYLSLERLPYIFTKYCEMYRQIASSFFGRYEFFLNSEVIVAIIAILRFFELAKWSELKRMTL